MRAAVALLAAGSVFGCAFDSDQTMPLEGQRLEEYKAADGRLADPDQYRIDEVGCVANADDPDRIDVELAVTNTGTTGRLFELEIQLHTADGGWEARRRELMENYLEPGESVERTTWVAVGDRPADEVACRLVVYDSPLEVFDN